MKLALIAATGASGKHLLEQALADGHHVIALVRSPDKVTIKDDKLEVKVVDIFSEESLAQGFTGCDAVVSCLGPPITASSFFKEVKICQDSMKIISTAMRSAGISRLVCMSGCCVRTSSGNPMFMEWLVKPLFLGRMFTDLAHMEDYIIEHCQDLNYTVVKPPELTNSEISDGEIIAIEGDFSPDYRLTIPRGNVTRFMLDCLNTEKWNNKLVSIGLKK